MGYMYILIVCMNILACSQVYEKEHYLEIIKRITLEDY